MASIRAKVIYRAIKWLLDAVFLDAVGRRIIGIDATSWLMKALHNVDIPLPQDADIVIDDFDNGGGRHARQLSAIEDEIGQRILSELCAEIIEAVGILRTVEIGGCRGDG